MRWNRKAEPFDKPTPWFAWHPVLLKTGNQWVWLETVDRVLVSWDMGGPMYDYYNLSAPAAGGEGP